MEADGLSSTISNTDSILSITPYKSQKSSRCSSSFNDRSKQEFIETCFDSVNLDSATVKIFTYGLEQKSSTADAKCCPQCNIF
jgi:hypothetical protein